MTGAHNPGYGLLLMSSNCTSIYFHTI